MKPLIEQFARQFGYDLNDHEETIEKFFKVALPGTITGKGLERDYWCGYSHRIVWDCTSRMIFLDWMALVMPTSSLLISIGSKQNDPSAIAPAQRVFIRHALDDNLDECTFWVGSFGFGDFTIEIPLTRAFLQVYNNISWTLRLVYFFQCFYRILST